MTDINRVNDFKNEILNFVTTKYPEKKEKCSNRLNNVFDTVNKAYPGSDMILYCAMIASIIGCLFDKPSNNDINVVLSYFMLKNKQSLFEDIFQIKSEIPGNQFHVTNIQSAIAKIINDAEELTIEPVTKPK